MTTRLTESTALAKGKGNVWRCRLISEGQGSSAFYPGDVLKEFGPTTFPKGTQLFLDHPTEEEEYSRGGARSIKDYAGALVEDAEWVEAERALYAPIKFIDPVMPLVESSAEDIALSIDVRRFELTEGENGQPVVAKMFPSPLNNVAIVPRGGRDGKIVSLIESYREAVSGDTDTINPNKETSERNTMTPEEIKALSEALSTQLVAALTPALTEALKPAPVEKDEKTEALDLAAVTESAVEAGLPAAARKRIVEALKADPAKTADDAKALIESEKTYIESLRESVTTEVTGRLRESGSGDEDFTIGAWK